MPVRHTNKLQHRTINLYSMSKEHNTHQPFVECFINSRKCMWTTFTLQSDSHLHQLKNKLNTNHSSKADSETCKNDFKIRNKHTVTVWLEALEPTVQTGEKFNAPCLLIILQLYPSTHKNAAKIISISYQGE